MQHNPQRGQRSLAAISDHSFVVIQVRSSSSSTTSTQEYYQPEQRPNKNSIPSLKFNFSAMKLFHRFRKVLMRLVFSSVPSSSSSSRRSSSTTDHSSSSTSRQRNSDRFEPPKTSCSSYYSSYSHYNEAIADCIEFFNKSAQDGILDARKSDVV